MKTTFSQTVFSVSQKANGFQLSSSHRIMDNSHETFGQNVKAYAT